MRDTRRTKHRCDQQYIPIQKFLMPWLTMLDFMFRDNLCKWLNLNLRFWNVVTFLTILHRANCKLSCEYIFYTKYSDIIFYEYQTNRKINRYRLLGWKAPPHHKLCISKTWFKTCVTFNSCFMLHAAYSLCWSFFSKFVESYVHGTSINRLTVMK